MSLQCAIFSFEGTNCVKFLFRGTQRGFNMIWGYASTKRLRTPALSKQTEQKSQYLFSRQKQMTGKRPANSNKIDSLMKSSLENKFEEELFFSLTFFFFFHTLNINVLLSVCIVVCLFCCLFVLLSVCFVVCLYCCLYCCLFVLLSLFTVVNFINCVQKRLQQEYKSAYSWPYC